MPGVLFSSDLAGLTANDPLAGWANGAGSTFAIEPNGTAGAASPKANGYGRNSAGDTAYWNNGGSGAIGDQCMRESIVVPAPASFAGHITPGVMFDPATGYFYQAKIVANSTQYGLELYVKNAGGVALIASAVYPVTASAGDILEVEIKRYQPSGIPTVEGRIWKKNAPAYPAATVTAANSSLSAGYPWLQNSATAWRLAGDLVITDTTASSGVFDTAPGATAPGATLTGASTIVGGTATATTPGTAAGATLTGVSSIVPGAATAIASLTTRILRNNTGTPLASIANCTLNIYNATTGALVLRSTGLTTTAAGRLVVTNAALTAGTTYAYEADLTAASMGRRLPTKAAA